MLFRSKSGSVGIWESGKVEDWGTRRRQGGRLGRRGRLGDAEDGGTRQGWPFPSGREVGRKLEEGENWEIGKRGSSEAWFDSRPLNASPNHRLAMVGREFSAAAAAATSIGIFDGDPYRVSQFPADNPVGRGRPTLPGSRFPLFRFPRFPNLPLSRVSQSSPSSASPNLPPPFAPRPPQAPPASLIHPCASVFIRGWTGS